VGEAYPVGVYSTQDRAKLAAVQEWENRQAKVECVVYYSTLDSELPADAKSAVLFDTAEVLSRHKDPAPSAEQLDWLKTIDLVVGGE
jgi:hypothetical protein